MSDPKQPPHKPGERQSPQSGSEPVFGDWDWRFLLWMLALLLLGMWLMDEQAGGPESLAYSEFKQQVRAGHIAEVTIKGDNIRGRYGSDTTKAPATDSGGGRRFHTVMPAMDDPDLMPLLEEHDVTIKAETTETAWWARALVGILPWLLLIGLIWYSMRAMQQRMGQGGGLMGFGKSRARRYTRESASETMADVAGAESAKAELQEIVDYLHEPERFRELGAHIPRGILLTGPPGTGKTLLARAVAGEAEVPFFSITGSEFIEMFVGVGASRVRDMFKTAKQEAPAIVFIDELDAIGRSRGSGLGGGNDEREQTLNQILSEMDGFSPHEAVIVMAATNRPDVLDAALLRPGRFDRKVTMERPNRKARLAILQVHSRKIPLAEDVDLEQIAAGTAGFSGADLANLVNEAALLTGRKGRKQVDNASFEEARDKILMGVRREALLTEDDKKRIAFHEAGHALLGRLLPHADPVRKVTVIPRGQALGATEQIPTEDRYNLPAPYLEDRITSALGGRVAEKLVFDELSSGAAQDLQQVTRIARQMVCQWGMSEKVGPVYYRKGEEHVFLGREMAQPADFSEHTELIDDEVRELIRSMEERAYELLGANRHKLDALAEALLEHETLDADAIDGVLAEARDAQAKSAQAGS